MNDFYIGWLPALPAEVGRQVRRAVSILALVVVLVATTLVTGQRPFAASAFEFHQYREWEGTVDLRPYPTLLVARPGSSEMSRYFLAGVGKHGAEAELRQFAGNRVHLRGELIYRGSTTMVQVAPGSVVSLGTGQPTPPEVDGGEQTLSGEIVDSKCYLGVMNPGSGKVHRDCAARCLSGGLPPVFVARGDEGRERIMILTTRDGNPIQRDLLPYVAEPVQLRGHVLRSGDAYRFAVDVGSITRLR